jgi:hypothetical protein
VTRRRWLGLGIVYVALWGLTALSGVPRIEAAVLSELVEAHGGRPPSAVTLEQVHADSDLTIADVYPRYSAYAWAVAPFVVLVDRGSVDGPLSGLGRRDLYVWFFGRFRKLHSKVTWIS